MQQIKDGHYVPGMREFADDLRAGSHLTGKRRLGGDELPVSVADAGPGDCYGALHMAT